MGRRSKGQKKRGNERKSIQQRQQVGRTGKEKMSTCVWICVRRTRKRNFYIDKVEIRYWKTSVDGHPRIGSCTQAGIISCQMFRTSVGAWTGRGGTCHCYLVTGKGLDGHWYVTWSFKCTVKSRVNGPKIVIPIRFILLRFKKLINKDLMVQR